MLDGLKNYLAGNGYENICVDMMPDAAGQKQAIGLFLWNAPRETLSGETSYYVQVQVRRDNYDSAKNDCKTILDLLDSGKDERLIPLDETLSCIGRIRRGPLLLERGAGYAIFYGEIVLWINE